MKKLLSIIAIITALTTFSQVPNYVPTNGLVGWWPFNGNANDESGNGHHGIVNGAVLDVDENNLANEAYYFDGNDRITIPHHSDFNVQSLSILITYKDLQNSAAQPNGNSILFSKRESSGWGSSFEFNQGGASWDLAASNSISGNITYGFGAPQVYGQWRTVIYTHDANSIKVYFDGTLIDSIGSPGVYNSNSLDITVGMRGNGWHELIGSISKLGIWNRALTQCEIKDLYNAQLNSVDVSAGNDLTVCEGGEIVLSGSGAESYVWNNGVLDTIPFIPTITQDYVVVGTDSNGCIGTDTVQVAVLPTSSSTQNETSIDSYVWSVNGQTYTQSGTYTDTLLNVLGCDSIVTLNLDLNFTGIPSENDNEFNVFPNPVNELLTIINSSNASKNIKLIDKQGRLVLESIISKETNTINLAHLESGNYLLFIEGNDSPIQIIKK